MSDEEHDPGDEQMMCAVCGEPGELLRGFKRVLCGPCREAVFARRPNVGRFLDPDKGIDWYEHTYSEDRDRY